MRRSGNNESIFSTRNIASLSQIKLFKKIMILVSIATLLMTGLLDFAFSILPDATVLYFIPIALGTMFVSKFFGFFMVFLGTLLGHLAKINIGIPSDILLLTDTTLHFLAFTFIAIIIGTTMDQFAKIDNFENRISNDINLAKEIHENSFKPLPKSLMGIDIGCQVSFAKELGGDYYHLSSKNGCLFFCIADISGKSLSAALFTSLLSQLLENAIEQYDNLCDIMNMVNRVMHSGLPDTMFVTMFVCVIEDNELRYMNAGHPPPFLFSQKTGLISNLESKNTTIVGIKPDIGCGHHIVEFETGDILLAMTDGANESLKFRAKPYDVFGNMLTSLANKEAQEITDEIFFEVTEGEVESLTDDIILFCLKKK